MVSFALFDLRCRSPSCSPSSLTSGWIALLGSAAGHWKRFPQCRHCLFAGHSLSQNIVPMHKLNHILCSPCVFVLCLVGAAENRCVQHKSALFDARLLHRFITLLSGQCWIDTLDWVGVWLSRERFSSLPPPLSHLDCPCALGSDLHGSGTEHKCTHPLLGAFEVTMMCANL